MANGVGGGKLTRRERVSLIDPEILIGGTIGYITSNLVRLNIAP
jgi:hypothetical protein